MRTPTSSFGPLRSRGRECPNRTQSTTLSGVPQMSTPSLLTCRFPGRRISRQLHTSTASARIRESPASRSGLSRPSIRNQSLFAKAAILSVRRFRPLASWTTGLLPLTQVTATSFEGSSTGLPGLAENGHPEFVGHFHYWLYLYRPNVRQTPVSPMRSSDAQVLDASMRRVRRPVPDRGLTDGASVPATGQLRAWQLGLPDGLDSGVTTKMTEHGRSPRTTLGRPQPPSVACACIKREVGTFKHWSTMGL